MKVRDPASRAPGVIKPEIKSPAGGWPQLRAAIEAGADAVYFGLTHFTARAKSGFTLAELPEVMRTLHMRGVKGYVTFNTLIFDEEILDAARGLASIAEAGADAIIVQDWAAVALAREIAPNLALHGSTQMSVTDAAGVRRAEVLGIHRLILGRELSLAQVRAVRQATDAELEIFVHGALCVSYSGQCFSSEAWGGRSANRGQCAQACRLPYEMLVDGRVEPLADARYLLSPGDLYAIEQIPEIVDIGITALKIEGRYKDADYVALTTRAYREAVDRAYASAVAQTAVAATEATDDIAIRNTLEQVYSRGLGPWFLTGTNHQTVVEGRAPRHRGVLTGSVESTREDRILIDVSGTTATPLKPGDGVVFDAADWRSPQEREEGGRLFSVTPQSSTTVEISFANGAINTSRIRKGDLLWRTSDPAVERLAKPYLDAQVPISRQPVNVHAKVRAGQPLQLEWTLVREPQISIHVSSPEPLPAASKQALTREQLQEQLSRLGNTAYQLAELSAEIQGASFAPVSLLNQLRRQAIELLEQRQAESPRFSLNDPITSAKRVLGAPREPAEPSPAEPRLHLLVRSPLQLDAALEERPDSITLDYLDLYGLKPSLERIRNSGIEARIAAPRILKPGEEKIADFLARCESPLLIRGAGLVEQLRASGATVPLDGDFSLNAANQISAHMLLDLGLRRIAPTHDLNAAQVTELAHHIASERLEVIAYQHLPVFHTEHCVFCRFLSTGTSYLDCGRPCEKHQVALRDTSGRAHAVIADVGCRNTVFGAEAQHATGHLGTWLAAGLRDFRLEFVHETPRQVAAITQAFRDFFAATISTESLQRALSQASPEGVTEGSLYIPASSALLPILQ